MGEFVLIETRARGKKWCVVRGKSQQLLERIAERRRVNFPKTRQDVMPRAAWELVARLQKAEQLKLAEAA